MNYIIIDPSSHAKTFLHESISLVQSDEVGSARDKESLGKSMIWSNKGSSHPSFWDLMSGLSAIVCNPLAHTITPSVIDDD